MTGPAGYRSAMARVLGPSNLDPDQMAMLRRAAWHGQGVVILRPDEIHDDQARRVLIDQANRLYGRRRGGRP